MPLLFLCSFFAQELPLSAADQKLDKQSSPEEIIDSLNSKVIKLEELFYQPHLDTGYQPIKLEATLYDPINVDLEFVLTKAIEDNLNLNIAKQDSIIAKWSFWKQFSSALPDFSVSAQKQNLDGTFYLNTNFAAPIDENQARMNFRIDHRAFSGGTTTFLTIAERYYKSAVEEEQRDQFNKTLYDSLFFYNQLLNNQVKLSSKLKALEEAKINLEQAKKFLKAGTGTRFDVVQADARLARAQQELIAQEASFRISEIDLAEHLNMDLLTPLKIEELDGKNIEKLSIIDDNLEIGEFLNIAKEKNPRIRAALKRKKGAFQQGLSKIGKFLPQLDIYADWSRSGEQFSDDFNITTIGFQTSLEFGKGSGLDTVSDLMGSRASVKKAKLQLRQEEQKIEKELRFAFLNYEKSKSFIEASQKELEASEEALRLSRLRYNNGLEVLANVILRESDYAEAEVKMIDSISNYNLAQAQLAYLMGEISIDKLL